MRVRLPDPSTCPARPYCAKPWLAVAPHQSVASRRRRRSISTRCEVQAPERPPAKDWRSRSRPIKEGAVYPAKEACSRCGLCDTYYVAHVKDACAFLGDGRSLPCKRQLQTSLAVPSSMIYKEGPRVLCRHVQDREARKTGAWARAVRFQSACRLSPVYQSMKLCPSVCVPCLRPKHV